MPTEAQLTAKMCRASYAHFVRTFWSVIVKEPLRWNWHIQLACDELQKCYERVFDWKPKEYDLILNQPPGTTKSIIHSVMSVPWAWTRMPHLRYLGASYSGTLAEKLSMYSRDVIKSEIYRACFPRVKIRSDKDTLSHFINTDGGERYATGSGGSATGLIHAHVIGIDDPINPEQALSEAEMASINHWMVHTLLNRKVDKEVSFTHVVGQRLAQGDPYDVFLEVSPRVKHFVIPADTDYEIKPPELVAHYVDGLMDPVRLPKSSLDEEKKKGDHYYAGQFGQSPVPAGGGTFKTALIRYGRPPGVYKKIVRFWDKAGTGDFEAKRRTSYTAGVKMAEDTLGRFWVLDVIRGRWDSWSRERVIRRTAIRDRRVTIVGQEQEPGSGGKDQARGSTRRLRGFRVVTLVSRSKKEARAEEFSVQVNAGNVWLPEQFRQGNDWIGWAKDYLEELRYWPFAAYKDQGDACLTAGTLIQTNAGLVPIERVRVGDFVLTRAGYRRVVRSGQTGVVDGLVEVRFANGSVLTGTPEHPVLTQGRGFVRLDALGPNDVCLVRNPSRGRGQWRAGQSTSMKRWCSTEFLTIGDCRPGGTFGVVVVRTLCTVPSTDSISGTSPVAMTFITRTGTRSTTTQVIWSVLANLSIGDDIGRCGGRRRCSPTWPVPGCWPHGGTVPMRDVPGIRSMESEPGTVGNSVNTSAKSVA